METERLIIDKLRPDDLEAYFLNIAHDRKVLETFVCRYAETPADIDFDRLLNAPDLFAVRIKATGEFIGLVLICAGTYKRDEADGVLTCEIGYGFGSGHWRQGYATEAVKKYLEYCFEVKKCGRVCASFFAGNDASRRVMEKCGMKYERFEEKSYEYLGGLRDLTYYNITKEEFENDRK